MHCVNDYSNLNGLAGELWKGSDLTGIQFIESLL